ncbi:MAG: Na+:solute symporter, partial [Planctomycetota bacterium]
DMQVLEAFYEKTRPAGPGWKPVKRAIEARTGQRISSTDSIASGIVAMVCATFLVYSLLFGTGYALYGNWPALIACLFVAACTAMATWRIWRSSFSQRR